MCVCVCGVTFHTEHIHRTYPAHSFYRRAIIIGRQRVEDLLSDSLTPTGKSFAILFRAAQYSPQLMAIFQQRFAALPYVSLDGTESSLDCCAVVVLWVVCAWPVRLHGSELSVSLFCGFGMYSVFVVWLLCD